MSTIMPHGEELRRAIAYVDEIRERNPSTQLAMVIEDAAKRFNLGPADCEFCQRFFAQKANCPESSEKTES